MNKEISVNNLKKGMFVVAVTKKKRSIQVKSPGYLTSDSSIQSLISSGVTKVMIDLTKDKNTKKRDLTEPKEHVNEAQNIAGYTEPEKDVKPSPPAKSIDEELTVASALFNDAKKLQAQLLNAVSHNEEINISEIKKNSVDLVKSVMRNEDALCCMTRLQEKDAFLVEHSLNVSILMAVFAKHLNMSPEVIEQLTLGAFLHDIGKVKISDEVLNKKGRFSEADRLVMKGHVQLSLDALIDLNNLPPLALEVIQQHHERLDGSGYPNQLSYDEISDYGRMIAIVDTYDDMTNEKSYKKAIPPINAFKKLLREAETLFDKYLVEQFIQCIGLYPVGTLVKLASGKIGIISARNIENPIKPTVRVFFNVRLNQNIPIKDIKLSSSRANDSIELCIKPEEFNLNLLKFFKMAFNV